jgi:hypothetical protein
MTVSFAPIAGRSDMALSGALQNGSRTDFRPATYDASFGPLSAPRYDLKDDPFPCQRVRAQGF